MKKNVRFLLVAAALFTFATASLSANPLECKNDLGFYVMGGMGPSIGGIQYQRWVTDRFGFTVDGSVFYEQPGDSYTSNPFLLNLNAELDVKMFEGNLGRKNAARLSAFFKVGYVSSTEYKYSTYTAPYHLEDYDFKNDAVVAAGFTVDVMVFEHISIPVYFGYSGSFPSNLQAGFAIGTGIRYAY